MILNRNYTMINNINDINLKLLDSGHAITKNEWTGNIISPMYTRLYYIIGGDPYIIKDGEKMPLEIGKCYLIPTGYSFRHACENSMEQLYFHVNLNDFNGNDLLRCAHTVMEYKPEESLIEEMLRCVHSDELIDSLRMRQQLFSSLLILIDKYNVELKTTHYSNCVLLAIEYIKSHLSLRLAVSDLAANSFVSESTLAKKFKTEVGMTIGSYIDDAIMFEAEQLLLKSDLSVLQISERFGFCDQFYFSRRFKLKYGETPQKYRKLRLI